MGAAFEDARTRFRPADHAPSARLRYLRVRTADWARSRTPTPSRRSPPEIGRKENRCASSTARPGNRGEERCFARLERASASLQSPQGRRARSGFRLSEARRPAHIGRDRNRRLSIDVPDRAAKCRRRDLPRRGTRSDQLASSVRHVSFGAA